jgi:hypothetical protein
MKFPDKPIKDEKHISAAGHEFIWNGYAWDISSTSNKSGSGSATASASTEEVKEFLDPDGKISVFRLSSTPLFGTLKVFLNGILQKEDIDHDYVLENNIITFAFIPDDISDIQCIYLKQVYVRITNEIPVGIINGNNNRYKLGSSPASNSEQIFLNGMLQRKDLDYIIEEDIVIFNEAPLENSVIICNYKI